MRVCAVSERRACRAIGQVRSTQRHQASKRAADVASRERVLALATQYGRYGYRQVTSMMRNEGWNVNPKYVYRVWREEGLKVPARQPKRARLWLSDGSIVRLRAEAPNHVWSYDFVSEQTTDGKKFRILNIIDEYTRECLASVPARTFKAMDVLYVLSQLFLQHGTPRHIRSDNGPEFVARHLRCWLDELGIECSFITPGSPWENGFIESFNGRMRAEFLNGELFHTLTEAKILIEQWRRFYNTRRPHSRLGYQPPAPESLQPTIFISAA
jgi:transposase InsO family protein